MRVVVAVPVASRGSIEAVASVANALACIETPISFFAIGEWYKDVLQAPYSAVDQLIDADRPRIDSDRLVRKYQAVSSH